MLKILKLLVVLLVKIGIVRRPKKEMYSVVITVFLDSKEIKKFPAEIESFGRMAARHEIKQRLKFKTATTAVNLGRNKDGEKIFEQELICEIHSKVLQKFPVLVNCEGRREAKFELNKRLTFTAGRAARKADLIKHLRAKAA